MVEYFSMTHYNKSMLKALPKHLKELNQRWVQLYVKIVSV